MQVMLLYSALVVLAHMVGPIEAIPSPQPRIDAFV